MSTCLSEQQTLDLQNEIEHLTKNPKLLADSAYQKCIFDVLRALERGALRVSSPAGLGPNCGDVPMTEVHTWVVHAWVKDAILFAMKLRKPQKVSIHTDITKTLDAQNTQERIYMGELSYHDKFDLQTNFDELNVRALPGALIREGAYVSPGTVIMPSFVNIGAWVGPNTMVDTWATVGSCAQIGKDVHIAGGVGIGGVLEPVNARPILIGDKAFLGSRVILVEGVVVGEGAILGANCCITESTPIYDVTGAEKLEYRGLIPPHAVVVPGTRMKEFPGGHVPLSCCYIIDYRGAKQDQKLQLNQNLRHSIPPSCISPSL